MLYFPNPQQPFHLFPSFAGHLFIPGSVVHGQAVAAFLHPVHRFLAGGVQALLQRVLGHGRDDDHGDVLHIAGLHDFFQVDVEEVAPGLAAEVVEHQKVVVADVIQVLLPVLPVQGEQVFYNFHEAGQQAAVPFVAQGETGYAGSSHGLCFSFCYGWGRDGRGTEGGD